ncbi:hypothetical protein O181_041152 [Austropuccinia psidii MF-1]|uniref:Uncharacterized protein n=1 Tax=Austropuccinia psidii MF-1 TaxID=1389203 RepID=A0A9Q3DK83_9BASI|nr:hypothetical protein [Austropuccinia psidii MF-1]
MSSSLHTNWRTTLDKAVLNVSAFSAKSDKAPTEKYLAIFLPGGFMLSPNLLAIRLKKYVNLNTSERIQSLGPRFAGVKSICKMTRHSKNPLAGS